MIKSVPIYVMKISTRMSNRTTIDTRENIVKNLFRLKNLSEMIPVMTIPMMLPARLTAYTFVIRIIEYIVGVMTRYIVYFKLLNCVSL